MYGDNCLNGGTCVNTQGSDYCQCPQGFTGERCEHGGTGICGHQAGIEFLVDVSENMTSVEDFVKMQDFVKILMTGFNYDKVEVGVTGFSSTVRSEKTVIEFGQFNSYVQLVLLLFDDSIQVDIVFSLTTALDSLRTKFARKTYRKVAVLISDGRSHVPIQAEQQASAARSEGIIIAAIGVGDSVFRLGLRDITGQDSYIFELNRAELTDPAQLRVVQDLMCNYVTDCMYGDNCLNGGTCVNTQSSDYCQCPQGFTGVRCEHDGTDVNDCMYVDNCLNGGICVNTQGSDYCQCPQGFTGDHCEHGGTDIDECIDSNTCRNGGTCVNTIGSYYCRYPQGWTGTHCDIDVNECLQYPCMNGGTCVNTVGSYKCLCMDGRTGQNCTS